MLNLWKGFIKQKARETPSPPYAKRAASLRSLFNALAPIGATPLQDNIGNETPSCSFYVKHFIQKYNILFHTTAQITQTLVRQP